MPKPKLNPNVKIARTLQSAAEKYLAYADGESGNPESKRAMNALAKLQERVDSAEFELNN